MFEIIAGILVGFIGWIAAKVWPSLVESWRRTTLSRVPLQRIELAQLKGIHGQRPLLQKMAISMYVDPVSPLPYRDRVQLFGHSVDGRTLHIPLMEIPGSTPTQLCGLHHVQLDWDASAKASQVLWSDLASRLRKDLTHQIDNDLVYALTAVGMVGEDTVAINCVSGDYDDYINSCEALNWSLCAAVMKSTSRSLRFRHKSIDDQTYLIQQAPTIARYDELRQSVDPFDFTNRVSAIGVNTLTIMARTDGRAHFFLHDRSKERVISGTNGPVPMKAEAIGTVHVVPAGTFQPILSADRDHDREFSIEFTLIREFAEEILGKDLNRNCKNYKDINSLLNAEENRTLKKLFSFFEAGKARTFFLGMGLDLLTLKPELLSLCLVNEDALHDTFKIERNWEGELDQRPFTRECIHSLLEGYANYRLLGAAAGALLLSYRHFDAISRELASIVR